MPRTDFTDKQKAEIFVLDRAICGYSGRSLWMLDLGIDGRYITDWIDHITPASLGGRSEIDNGLCASSELNYMKGKSTDKFSILYCRGLPTPRFFLLFDTVPESVSKNLERFSALHPSDWYFNRAIWRTCLGIGRLASANRGIALTRRAEYYAEAALRVLNVWRRQIDAGGVASLEDRGLIPSSPSDDQQLLLSVRTAATTKALIDVMQQGLPIHEASRQAWLDLERIVTEPDAKTAAADFVERISKSKNVSHGVRTIVLTSIARLFTPVASDAAFNVGAPVRKRVFTGTEHQ